MALKRQEKSGAEIARQVDGDTYIRTSSCSQLTEAFCLEGVALDCPATEDGRVLRDTVQPVIRSDANGAPTLEMMRFGVGMGNAHQAANAETCARGEDRIGPGDDTAEDVSRDNQSGQ
jgi:hypothetical protein